jgi:hypothetical protein
VAVTIPQAPAGTSSALVEFGYAENGTAQSFYCTARQEACAAQGATIDPAQPFRFLQTEAASITGMPCASGCTITVPAVAGRVLYYLVQFRDGQGNVIGRGNLTAMAVP